MDRDLKKYGFPMIQFAAELASLPDDGIGAARTVLLVR